MDKSKYKGRGTTYVPSSLKLTTTRENFISKQPTLEDPFELQHVFVDNVKSMKGEKGLFAQKNVEIGQVLAYYAGILWNTTEEELLSTDFSTAQLYVTCILVKNVLL